ncbi:protein-disulfide reductase DsbD [Halopseudomonas laoshanensis]|uniref:Thiol:disulfide interchange protein DsbD n=1 Tax=Halopseudomonas laoshanensis TaxID=2268758 RepID=A0A7V7GTR9_9GAMM|nr:protein-disulfide reductase DsbD [Halopseudomonas laoshanensis]KAA0694823.1 protein-disulfide reductase DsbD [Halopseudomonas laoshanensis]
MVDLLLRLVLLLCLLLPGVSQASLLDRSPAPAFSGLVDGTGGQADFLPVAQAFKPGVVAADDQRIRIQFDIAPGYYLYRHRLDFRLTNDSLIRNIVLPDGIAKHDEFFGDVEVYYDRVEIILELAGAASGQQLSVDFQGCADAGLCYPPETVQLQLPGEASSVISPALPDTADTNAERLSILALALFFLAGIGLTFTPCVLPMLPILSSMVVGRKDIDRPRALALAGSYVLAMALTFALVGALIGLFGAALNIQARLQSPAVLITFAVFFGLFALAMFGVFDLRLPAFLREPLERAGSRTRGGSIPGTALMGALSTLVVSPCISAPLAGALVYISSTGDAVGGALRLFTLALGMGLPLLLVAVFGNAFLPRSGPWLNSVKNLFGFGLLGVAIWLLERVLPGPVSLALWATLAAGLAVQLGLFDRSPRGAWGHIGHVLALLSAIYAAIALTGALAGASDPLRPLMPLTAGSQRSAEADSGFFTRVSSQADLQRELELARKNQRPALVELYADWCISCKIMERTILAAPEVREQLEPFARIKFDLTDNTADQRSWLSAQKLFGPPAFLYIDAQGNEIEQLRLMGETDKETFLTHLRKVTVR